MNIRPIIEVLKSNSPVDSWKLASWSFAVSFLACSLLLIGSAIALHWLFLSIASIAGISFLVSFLVLRNAFVAFGVQREQLDAIWKQSAYSFGATALIAIPICLVVLFLIEIASRLLGLGISDANFVSVSILLAVACLCLVASAVVGWRILGRKVFRKFDYAQSL